MLDEFGPCCDHEEPTVLRILNGRKIYVCRHYPDHHCTKWCPADVFLMEDGCHRPDAGQSSDPMEQASEPGHPDCEVNVACTPDNAMAISPHQGSVGANGTPPSRQASGQAASLPAAPSKSHSHGSVTSKLPNGVKRSLVPIFNQYAPAALRANRLGGRFVTLRPQAHAIVQMQRKMSGRQSGDLEAAFGGVMDAREVGSPEVIGKKRPRPDGDDSMGISVKTASRGPEPPLAGGGKLPQRMRRL